MAEGAGLENRYTLHGVSGVRIPLLPQRIQNSTAAQTAVLFHFLPPPSPLPSFLSFLPFSSFPFSSFLSPLLLPPIQTLPVAGGPKSGTSVTKRAENVAGGPESGTSVMLYRFIPGVPSPLPVMFSLLSCIPPLLILSSFPSSSLFLLFFLFPFPHFTPAFCSIYLFSSSTDPGQGPLQ